jgi:predicted permease
MFGVGYRYCDALNDRDCRVVEMIGRLAPGKTIVDAQSELDVLAKQLISAFPIPNRTIGVHLVPARGAFPHEPNRDGRLVGLLLGSVGLLVLIACANIGGLLLARGSARKKEVSIRLALGAGRFRILRQFMIESAVLAAMGTLLGLLVAEWANDAVSRFYAVHYTGALNKFDMAIGMPVLLATVVLSATTAILCGLAPALQAARTDTLPNLKVEAGTGRARSRGRDALVVMQVAMSVVLLVGAGLLVRSMMQLYGGPGIDSDRIVLMRLRPSLVGHEATRARAFQRAVIERLMEVPGVEAAATAENLPLMGGGIDVAVRSVGSGSDGIGTSARASHVGADYFQVIGVPLLAGRDFDSSDRPDSPRVAIVDELVAGTFGGPAQIVGRILSIDETPARIVGVARAAQYHSATEQAFPYVYFNYWQQTGRGFSADSRTHVRVRGDARAMMPALRRAVAAADPSVPISEDYPLHERVTFTFQPVRVAMMMLGGFGLFALVLCSLGAYGVVAFMASMRTREVAIRLALGADTAQVRRMIVADGLRLAIPGAVLGTIGAFGSSRFLRSLLYGVDAHDPQVFGLVPLLLVVVVLGATYLPLRRASRIDPSAALRHE